MTRCPRCGTEIKKDVKFCPHCGEKILDVIDVQPEDIFDESMFSKNKNKRNNNTNNYIDASYRELDENGFSDKPFVNPGLEGRGIAILSIILSLFGGLGIIPSIYGLSKKKYEKYTSYYQIAALISILWIVIYIILSINLH